MSRFINRDPEPEPPPLICTNCHKGPDAHLVIKEELICPGGGFRWKYTDDRRARDILKQLDELDARQERLRDELARLTKQPWAQEA